MSECQSYDMKWWHYFVPSINEFYQVCDSYDKTYMFLVASLRFVVYVLIANFLYDNGVIKYNTKNKTEYVLFIVVLIINLINMVLLIASMFREQKNAQVVGKITIQRPEPPKKSIIPILVFKDDQTATPDELAESTYSL